HRGAAALSGVRVRQRVVGGGGGGRDPHHASATRVSRLGSEHGRSSDERRRSASGPNGPRGDRARPFPAVLGCHPDPAQPARKPVAQPLVGTGAIVAVPIRQPKPVTVIVSVVVAVSVTICLAVRVSNSISVAKAIAYAYLAPTRLRRQP